MLENILQTRDRGIQQADASPEAAGRPASSCKISKSLLEDGTAEVRDNAGQAAMK